jgi:hypothetical protein
MPDFLTDSGGDTVGEIVVVANAFEESKTKELSFENMREGRVVFYSDNVHKGQFLNFNNMPIYGPIKYNGAPFAFRVAIFELDVVSEQAKEMISTIAQAGAMAYPPAAPILNILNGVGDTFLNQDQTDTEFRYTMILDPKSGSSTVNNFGLEVGNYVLIRTEERDESIDWTNIVLDENSGQVYKYDDKGSLSLYKDNSYLVVEINKNVSSVGIDLAENNYSSLMNSLN